VRAGAPFWGEPRTEHRPLATLTPVKQAEPGSGAGRDCGASGTALDLMMWMWLQVVQSRGSLVANE
jgi:hypothetical protein